MPLPELVDELDDDELGVLELGVEVLVLVDGVVVAALDVSSSVAEVDEDVPVDGVVALAVSAAELDTPEINPNVSTPAAPAAMVPAIVALVCSREARFLLMT